MRKLSFIFLMLVAFVFTVSAQRTFKHPGSILAVSDLESTYKKCLREE